MLPFTFLWFIFFCRRNWIYVGCMHCQLVWPHFLLLADSSLPPAESVSFDTLLQESDFIVCTAALNQTTRNKFDKIAFIAMKKSAIFVNTSRGGEKSFDSRQVSSTFNIMYITLKWKYTFKIFSKKIPMFVNYVKISTEFQVSSKSPATVKSN